MPTQRMLALALRLWVGFCPCLLGAAGARKEPHKSQVSTRQAVDVGCKVRIFSLDADATMQPTPKFPAAGKRAGLLQTAEAGVTSCYLE